jgi:pimeloyl-ACP methyl ester carboxylesterase
MATVMWKDEAARERQVAWCEQFESRIPGQVERRTVETAWGPSSVLLTGDEAKPTLVALHAMRTSAAHLVSELGGLISDYRIIAPELPDQSVLGLQKRLPLNDDTLACWLAEVLDGLRIESADLLGVSWGGFVARLFASTYPERVRRLVLLVPAGIVNGSHITGLTKMAWPMLRYKIWPNEKNLRRLLDPLVTTWDETWMSYMADTLADLHFDMRIPPLARDEALRKLTMPTLVLGADQDISFPGPKLVKRVQSLVPNSETEVIAHCKHCPPWTDEFRSWLAERVGGFLRSDA